MTMTADATMLVTGTSAARVPPPPCGEGMGVGVSARGTSIVLRLDRGTRSLFHPTSRPRLHPTPNPSPSRGGESVLPLASAGARA